MARDESVLVIPTSHFHAVGHFHGFRPADEAYRSKLLDPAMFSFRPRSQVETDPTFKQLVPYVVLRCGGDVLQYRRGSSGTEARLRALRSIGIGGHVCEEDAVGGDPCRSGMRRELEEEVEIRTTFCERMLGFVNDDSFFVGSVHLGIVHVLDLEAPDVKPREDALADAGFMPLERIFAEREEFETWSQFTLEALW